MIVHPEHMDVIDWTDSVTLLLIQDNLPLKLEDPENWRQWGENLLGEPDIVGQDIPDPQQFDDWRVWAERVFETIELTG
jgi:hypothetical protein